MFHYKKNIEDLELLLDSTQICSDVIAMTETRILKSKFPVTDINLTNCSYEYCPTGSSAGGTMLYIGNHLSYKPRNDLLRKTHKFYDMTNFISVKILF